jgi:hypothetical protein
MDTAAAPLTINSNIAMPSGAAPCATIWQGLGGKNTVLGKGASNQARTPDVF